MIDPTPVAVTSRSFSRHPMLRAELLERYANVTFNDAALTLEGSSLIAFLRGHVKAITGLERLDARIFEAVPELRVVSKYGVGLDMIDADAMKRCGVALAWTPGVNRRSVAELALAFMLALLHRVPEGAETVKAGAWRQLVGRQLSEKTVGIVGLGRVGQDVAMLLQPFGCRLLAHDIVDYRHFCRRYGVTPVGLDDLVTRADVITLHLPLDSTTRGMFDRARLRSMKAGAVLINTARGGLVDEVALQAALEDGHLAGAALDVLACEPPDGCELIRLPNVLVTPHIGGSAEEAILAMGRAAIRGLDAMSTRQRVSAR